MKSNILFMTVLLSEPLLKMAGSNSRKHVGGTHEKRLCALVGVIRVYIVKDCPENV
jgi:hypothetical protein